jgi:hypothetical protein
MRRILPLINAAFFAVACSDSFAPTLNGRWASPGVELRMTPLVGEFVVACSRPVRLSPNVRFDESGSIRFSGTLTNSSGSRPFAFAGELVGDTLVATMSVTQGSSGVVTYSIAMMRDRDPLWELLNCAP